MDLPQTAEQAKVHITQIRRSKGLDRPQESNTSDLENALIILSEQLYQKSTHFLSELIQNADDNTYDQVRPTLKLTLTYDHRTLRIDCNEIGFGRSNVDAICKIGRSTKSSMDDATRYIGEKGIGFKSVFKVSDIVWIQSGHYSFKFNKHEALGMIAPTWSEFPEFHLEGNTSILLQLSPEYEIEELMDELKSLDARILMFLRKLKRVEVTIYGRLGETWTSTLKRRDVPNDADGANIVKLQQDAASFSFKVIRLPVSSMPRDPKRPDRSTSEIFLAFPFTPFGKPWIAPQKTYAFLPIRDHGFKFLLQADFLLTASREDIDASSLWNRRLLVAIPEAFHQAVRVFNEGELRYSWMRYLPDRPVSSDVFQQPESGIIRCLARSHVLESLGGLLASPQKLKLVPMQFRGKPTKPMVETERGGERITLPSGDSESYRMPLIQTGSTKAKYLSYKYSYDDETTLLRLGVRPLSTEEFLGDLRTFISEDPQSFQSMDLAWHSSLSEALIYAIQEQPSTRADISHLPLVPLIDGQWVAPGQQQICFAESVASSRSGVPKGIPIGEVDRRVLSDKTRRNLFVLLGAETYSQDMVCDAIVVAHKAAFNPEILRIENLISHAAFLYHAGWKNSGTDDLWVATEDGHARRGSQTYTDSVSPHSAKVLFGGKDLGFSFLDTAYSNAPWVRYNDGMEWMQHNLRVAEYPRLVISLFPTLVLANDFRILAEKDLAMPLVLLLRDQWDRYSAFFVRQDTSDRAYTKPEHPLLEESRRKLRQRIAGLHVSCRGGGTCALGQTVLPLTEIMTSDMNVTTFIDVPSPENMRWKYLAHFGVIVDQGVMQFIQYIRQMKGSGAAPNVISAMYKHIQVHGSEQEEMIRKIFHTEELIHIPPTGGQTMSHWVQASVCVWSGPKWLRKTPCLEDIYPENYAFFCQMLGLGKTKWNTIIDEAQHMEASDNVDYISEVFKALSSILEQLVSKEAKDEMVSTLSEARIFPIDAGISGSTFDYLCKPHDIEIWFIADRWHLKKSFEGQVPLLALKVDVIEKMRTMIKMLGLEYRLLSHVAGAITNAAGPIQRHSEFTNSLREKACHIARLMLTNNFNIVEAITLLCNILVYTAEEVVVTWLVKAEDGDIVGRADSGRVKVDVDGKTMKIYLRKKDADAIHAPLELRELLANTCGLTEATHIRLLDFILSEHDLNEIDDELTRRGFAQSVPRFDEISNAVQASGSSALLSTGDSVQPVESERYFAGRKAIFDQQQYQLVDAVEPFLEKFNLATAFQSQLAKPWSEADADHMLAHLCRLENIDPWALLPQDRGHWNQILKLTDQAPGNVTAVHWDMGRHIHDKEHLLKLGNSFPATVLQDSEKNLRIIATTAIQNKMDEELLFAAEFYVSRLFEKHLKESYIPNYHWTSALRSKAGLAPLSELDTTTSTFTIQDIQGTFTNFLVDRGYKDASSWRTYPTYHIEVCPSEGDIQTGFCLHPAQVNKAWKLRLRTKSNPAAVFILIHITDARSQPKIALFIDPWQLHADGLFHLTSLSQYEAVFDKGVHGIMLDGPDVQDQERGLGNLFQRKRRSKNRNSLLTLDPIRSLYRYDRLQLNETRILELDPGDESAPLSGRVIHIKLEHDYPYYALSYVWGPAMLCFRLQTPHADIPLTSSLHSALRRLRSSEEAVHIWVDAICINQRDDHEKSIQIRMLPKIFEKAQQVLAWIGEEKDNSKTAIQTLLQIRTVELSPTVWPDTLPQIPHDWRNGVPSSNDKVWWDIRDLFQRPWFARAWITQEVVLAYDIKFICGHWEIDWDNIIKAVEICLERNADLLLPNSHFRQVLPALQPVYALGLTREAFRATRKSPRFHILSLLDIFSYTKSTNECDKLFALLGIASDTADRVFDPDYSSTLEIVVRRYAEAFVKRGNALDLLYRAGVPKAYPYCSWVPRWTKSGRCRTLSTWRGSKGTFKAAGRTQAETYICATDPNLLLVKGIRVDTIVQTSMLSLRDREIITVINDAHDIIDELKSYPTGESRSTVKLKVPIGSAVAPCADDISSIKDLSTEGPGEEQLGQAFDWQESFTAVYYVRDIIRLTEQPKDKRENSWKYYTTAAAFMKRLSDGRFIVTKRGYVGFAPYDARVGDIVYIMQGGAVPFIVRQKHHVGKGNVRADLLIGEAYIHGLMYGEALSLQGIRKETVALV